MGLSVNIPLAGQNAKVRVNGDIQTICAMGSASRTGSVYPDKIWAKIYLSDPFPPDPSPPADATQGTIFANDQWQFLGTQEIPGAISSGSSPYPENWLVVWAEYDGPPTSYDVTVTSFLGVASTTTDCSS